MTEAFGERPEWDAVDIGDFEAPKPETRAAFEEQCMSIEAFGEVSSHRQAMAAVFDPGTGSELVAGVTRVDITQPDGSITTEREVSLITTDPTGSKDMLYSRSTGISRNDAATNAHFAAIIERTLEGDDSQSAQWLSVVHQASRLSVKDRDVMQVLDSLLEEPAPAVRRQEYIHYALMPEEALPDGTRILYAREAGPGPNSSDPEEAVHKLRIKLPDGTLYRYSRMDDATELLHIGPEITGLLEFDNDDTYIHEELRNYEEQGIARPRQSGVAVTEGKLRALNDQLHVVHNQLLLP